MSSKKKTQFFYNDALISKSAQDSSFRAVKNLIEADNNMETVKNRIRVLQINEQRNLSKISTQQEMIEKISMVRNEHLQELRKLGVSKKERERMVEQVRQRNEQFRQGHKEKMTEVREAIEDERSREYAEVVETRELNESLIMQSRLSSLHHNQDRRNAVVQNEEQSKENILKYYDDKTRAIYQRAQGEIQKVNRSREKKERQLQDISNLEMEMLQRHSQSQVAYKEMKSKLDTMLGKIRHDKRKDVKEMKSSVHRGLVQEGNLSGLGSKA